jgi:hypothetical protein
LIFIEAGTAVEDIFLAAKIAGKKKPMQMVDRNGT